MTGPIPLELGSLTGLRVLDLGGNELTGIIPPELGQLRELRVLNLSGNRLGGLIPPELGRLTEIRELYLGRNQLGGAIPPELGDLANALLLGLDRNALAGPIPEAFNCLTELRGLYLSENQLTGPVPEWIGALSYIEELDLCDNQLVGAVPDWVGNIQDRGGVCLSGNRLSGSLPCGKPTQSSLRWGFYIGEYCLDGPTSADAQPQRVQPARPEFAGERAALVALYNAAGGSGWTRSLGWLSDEPLDSWRGVVTDDSGHVIDLDLSNNGLEGAIPADLARLTHLRVLNLADNELTGQIPSSLGDLARLDVVPTKTPHDSMASSGELFPSRVVAPSDDLVVEGVIPEAAVQVADEAVAEGAQRLVVRIAGGAAPIVERSAAWAALQRAQRPSADGVVEPPVADEARSHGVLASGCYGQRRRAGVVPAGERQANW